MRPIVPLCVILLLLPLSLGAETIAIDRNLSLQLELPGGAWQLLREAPESLVEETIEHLRHELAGKEQAPTPEKVREAARRRLAANEAYLCQAETGACLAIDFSPLRPGELPPSVRAVRASARYAAEGLADEDGVGDLKQRVREISFPGASSAHRIDASYRQHGEARTFIGIVGFAHPHWFYLYYTDHLRDAVDTPAMERALKSARIVTRVKP